MSATVHGTLRAIKVQCSWLSTTWEKIGRHVTLWAQTSGLLFTHWTPRPNRRFFPVAKTKFVPLKMQPDSVLYASIQEDISNLMLNAETMASRMQLAKVVILARPSRSELPVGRAQNDLAQEAFLEIQQDAIQVQWTYLVSKNWSYWSKRPILLFTHQMSPKHGHLIMLKSLKCASPCWLDVFMPFYAHGEAALLSILWTIACWLPFMSL